MKNNHQDITPKIVGQNHRSASTDILVSAPIVERNRQRLVEQPRRKRRQINYAKKISNDAFIFNL